jgi:serine/threonine-protein kinase
MASSPAISAGRRFGKYTLVAKLATGGMAEIFLARLQGAAGFEKLVVIKRILPHLARDQQFVAMFLDEARIAARISHPQVCQVFELGELDGRYFIAMEYLEGVPLASFRRADLYWMPPDPQLVVGMVIQACEGLHHAHQLKGSDGASLEVVHRDVSPNNLFVTVDGVVKVLDFGIAKVQDASVRTTTGAVKGTYAYMAPEQLRGERLDRRTDVFAMGIVLWETLVQKHLFRRSTDFLTFQAITTDPIPDVCELRPEIPPAVGEAIARAMSRDREQRFPTARALGEALAAAVAPLGGPLPASAVSEEVVRAFPAQLREQHKLIHLAQTGGALDLEDDVGPVLSHGTEMLTTPVSSLQRARDTVVSDAPIVHPPAPARSSSLLTIVLVAIIALAIGGVGLYVWNDHEQVVATAPADAVRAAHVSIDAAVPVDAVEVTVLPADAAPVAVQPPVDAAVTIATHTDNHPPHVQPPPPVVKGPPGFITIDSTPVYATIFVDGKRLGDTPLVRIELPAGRHTVRAVAPSGAAQNLAISIEAGKTAQTRRIEW